jgi:hypothetical protein
MLNIYQNLLPQLQDRGVKYSSQSYKSTASNIILTPRQQQSLSPLPTPTPRRQQQPLSPLLTPTPRQQRSRSPLLTPPRHDENALQLQVNNLEVRVAQQANELNDLSTIQAYPTEYPTEYPTRFLDQETWYVIISVYYFILF